MPYSAMDEDLGVKAAPVTRLRRRMSVEAEDSPLPTTPSTPTKKRATRLAAKPQLELIDEVATENVPKRTTRKAAVKENVEADTTTATPTTVTPSRRSTRIRSNTSILLETTTTNIESPRAKRALRRTSQIGSDTESSTVTPARQTRRTRKDSATSVDKPAGAGEENEVVVTSANVESNTEHPERNSKVSKELETDLSPSTRKSPRLQNKSGGKADVEAENVNKDTDESPNNSVKSDKSSKDSSPVKSNLIKFNANKSNQLVINEDDENTSPKVNKTEDENLTTSCNILVNKINSNDDKNNALNKSTSAIERIANDLKNKRNRTKSWTTLCSPSITSDNVEVKETMEASKTPNTSITGSGDGLLTSNERKSRDEPDMKSPSRSINTSKSAVNAMDEEIVPSHEKILELERLKSDTVKLFENPPNNQQSYILIEDSDSCSVGRLSIDIQTEGDDQCVPVVEKKHETSVEPMDIDESMPVNVTIDDFSDKSNASKEDIEVSDKRKSSVLEKSILKDENGKKSKSFINIQTPKEDGKNDSLNKSIKDTISSKVNSPTSVQEKLNYSAKDKSDRSSSFSQVFSEIDESRKSLDKSQRKSSICDENNEKQTEISNKSKRKSSISLNVYNVNASRKSSVSICEDNAEKLNESSNKSKRQSSISQNVSIVNESRKSAGSICEDDAEKLNVSSNKSMRQSSISQNVSNVNESRKSAGSICEDDAEKLNVSSNKSKRQSSISQNVSNVNESRKSAGSICEDDAEKLNESSNKSKRQSSISQNVSNVNESRKSAGSICEDDAKKLNDSSNKSTRKSSISQNVSDVNESRKSSGSICEDNAEKLNDSSNKSKRKSSISQNVSNVNESRKSAGSICEDDAKKLNDSSNKSKIKTSISQNVSNVNESRKSSGSICEDNAEKLNDSSNKSKRKSSISQNVSNVNESRKSSGSIGEDNAEKLNQSSNKSKRQSSISQNNSTVNQKSIVNEGNVSKSSTNSRRSSSVSQTGPHNLEKSGNENKSTLIISQLKDVSTKLNDTNNAMSPNVTNNVLSKSMNDPDIKNKGIDKKNPSNYLTSTPIQQKSLQMLTMQINSSIISPTVDNKNNSSEKLSKQNAPEESESSDETDEEIKFKNKNVSLVALKKKFARAPSSSDSSDDEPDTESKTPIKKAIKKSPNKKLQVLDSSDSEEAPEQDDKKTPNKKQCNQSDSKVGAKNVKTPDKKSGSTDTSNDSDEEVSKDRSKICDDEASEASGEYESGDSQNEEDRRYEAENEIVEKGETLESDAEFSDDSDYEKDSFIVSSDAEDNEILSGTGDDLSLSDNELTMGAKSKHKFNERKLKQQKKASREMYQARHENDESANSSQTETAKPKKSKRQRLESSTLESENEDKLPKKSNRLRIDSSQDSMIRSEADESISIKKKKTKRLSESVDITSNEKEITVFNQSTVEKNDPLSIAVKQEPKTPQKDFDMSTVAINDNIEEAQVYSNVSIMQQTECQDPLQATIIAEEFDDSSSSDNMEIIQNYDSVLNNLSMHTKKIKTVDTSLNLNKKSKVSKDPMIDQLNLTQIKKSKKKKSNSVEVKLTEPVKSQAKVSKDVNNDEDFSDSIDMKLLFPEDSNDSEINASQFKPKMNEEAVEDFIPLKRTEAQTNIPGNMDTGISELNVSKKKNKKRKSSLYAPEEVTTNPETTEEPEDINIIIDTTGTRGESETYIAGTNSSKKKKNKKNKSFTEDSKVSGSAAEIDCTDGVAETVPVEISFTNEKKQRRNKSFDIAVNNVENSFTVTEIHSGKKESEFFETQNESKDNTVVDEMPVNVSIKSDKKKKKNKSNVSQTIEPDVEAGNSTKKKSKASISVEDVEPETQYAEPAEIPNAETSINSEKKKRKKKKKSLQNVEVPQNILDITDEESDDAPVEMSYKSEKKSDATDTVTDEAPTSNEKKKRKKNKKKKNKNVSQSMENSNDDVNTEQDGDVSMKRKRKASGNLPVETEDVPIIPLRTSNEKKKRKVQIDDEYMAAYDETEPNKDGGSSKKSKKNKKLKHHDDILQDEVPQHNGKKRKNRDDDSEEKIHKVSKQNSFDKIHVPKIPESVIKQLIQKPSNEVSEKPQNKHSNKKNKKATAGAIATMPFLVEEAERRKNKPSNYLEQSIYLNDSPVKTKNKQKRNKDKLKVLPFIPTALTSDSGYTSNFNINVLPRETQFVAQASNIDNFRESFLGAQRIKKLGTFERCKIHRSQKISKF